VTPFAALPRDQPAFPAPTAPEPRHPVVVVGAGPVGLTVALDLARRGVPTVLLDDNTTVSTGSRAICWAKRSLEIFDRLGVAQPMLERGVTWKLGRTYHRDAEVFSVDLQPEAGHKLPAFINLQQWAVEAILIAACAAHPLVELRFGNRVIGLERHDDHAAIGVATETGNYVTEAAYVLACDGARSPLRAMLHLDFEGELFEERFLIADIEMEADFPPERRFWFEPPFHEGQSALLHKQPGNLWRIDLQLGWQADPEVERRPETIIPRIRRVVGDRPFRLDWTSIYTFQCRRLARFVHGPVIFLGDSAHVVSPFGARGGNGGIQDADNLAWKLAAILDGSAARGFSPPTTPSAPRPPTRTSPIPPAPPASCRRPPASSASSATRPCASPPPPPSPAPGSTPAGSPPPAATRSPQRPTTRPCHPPPAPARPPSTCRSATAFCSTASAKASPSSPPAPPRPSSRASPPCACPTRPRPASATSAPPPRRST
jgi:2-polyprenyl-6-methoxyphenol hydroxylase-like FAD-dependent oxidoreductase